MVLLAGHCGSRRRRAGDSAWWRPSPRPGVPVPPTSVSGSGLSFAASRPAWVESPDGAGGSVGTMEFWELIAREAIRDLVARYNANADTGRFDQVMELFSPD